MKVLGLAGPGSTALAETLSSRLDGRVAVVEPLPERAGLDQTSASTTYGVADDGSWVGAGSELSLSELLDRLAVDNEYALLVDVSAASVPTVAVGDVEVAGDVALSADEAAGVDADEVVELVETVEPHESLQSLVARVKRSPRADRAGAIATFTGRVRAKEDADDSKTIHLEFEKYDEVADERMEAISRELADRDGVQDVVMHHRTGRIEDGEDIVFVVVLAGHREEAFRTVRDGINRLKDEVPIFKKETTLDSQFWVHDRS
ncbi:MAG: molybdopterin synthase [Halobacteriota archaeon]